MSEQGRELVYEWGSWQVHLGRRELLASGVPVPIGGRAFEIVTALVQSANHLVSKNELMDKIWPNVTVEENTLQVHISAIRRALGQDRNMLRTLSGRGYQLLGKWTPRQQVSAVLPAVTPLLGDPPTPLTHSFPLLAERLIGREVAARNVRDLLSAYRVVTLTGPGGIGKTSLAIETMRSLIADFDGAVWYVELASLQDPALVPSAAASALGLKLSGEISAEAVARAVGAKRLLLLLDNCEHVIDAAADLVEAFLCLCPNAVILATSREVLRVTGEYVCRVPPLEVPALGERAPNHILESGAVALFIAKANALHSDFSPQADMLPAIGAICRHLDGIPLAIEFAAARAAMLGVPQVTADLRNRFSLLTRGRRKALPRHRTLRAVLDWSHDLLTGAERLLLRRLGIFPGGFTLEAVAGIMTDTALDAPAVTDGVASLVAKSLIMFEKSETGTRWTLLETTRAYAFERLAEAGEVGQTAKLHAEFYLALFTPFGAEGQLQAAIDELGRYQVEVDNLRAALEWAFSPDGDPTLGIALTAAAADFWAAASLMPEACEWAGKALAQLGDTGTRCEMVLQCSFGISLLFTRGMKDDARTALRRALELAREFGDFDYQQRATNNLWLFSARASAFDDALTLVRAFESVDGFGDVQSRAVLDCWIGIVLIYRAEHADALMRVQRAIEHYPGDRRRRDVIRFANDLPTAAGVHIVVSLLSRGLLDSAVASARSGVERARATRLPVVLCLSLAWAAGYVFLTLSELETAAHFGDELIEHAFGNALRPYHAAGLCVRGSLAARRDDPEGSVVLLKRGLTEMRDLGYQQFYPFFAVELAAALGVLGRIDEGLAELEAALRFAVETGHLWFVPETWRIKAQLLALRNPDDPAAEDCLHHGLAVAREQDALFWELRLALSLARLAIKRNHHEEVYQILAPVHARFTEGFGTADLLAARGILDAIPPR